MPTYGYKCQACDHQFEKFTTISKYREACSEPCPSCNEKEVEQDYSQGVAAICDPVRIGVRKHSEGWKEVLAKVRQVPGGKVEGRLTTG